MALLGSAHAKDACRMLVKLTTGLCQCAKDCGPHKCTHIYANPSNPSRPSSFIKIFPEFKKKISMVEELSEPTKHANRITIPIFLIMKATILDKFQFQYSDTTGTKCDIMKSKNFRKNLLHFFVFRFSSMKV